MNWIIENRDLIELCLLAMGLSYMMCFIAFKALSHMAVMDFPGERSNHKIPTPVGGGIGFSLVLAFLLWVAESYVEKPIIISSNLILGIMLLALISLLDDVRGLPVRLRIFAQAVAMFMVLKEAHQYLHILDFLPLEANIILVAVAWFWFINLYNFMDGIDGIATVQAIAIALGVLCVGYIKEMPEFFYIGLCVISCVSPFLLLNWHPARIFMGDSGSITLGFILGITLISLAAKGLLAAAFILPAYFVGDATYTIFRRLKDGEKIWQAHSKHFYQQAVRGGLSHARVSCEISLLNLVLIVLAAISALYKDIQLFAVVFAYLLAGVLMMRFARIKKESDV